MANSRFALGILNGVSQGLSQTTDKLSNLMLAAEKIKREKKVQDQEYKLNEMKIEQAGIQLEHNRKMLDEKRRSIAGAIIKDSMSPDASVADTMGQGYDLKEVGGFLMPDQEEWKPRTREEKISYEKELQGIKGKNIANPDGLNPDQQVQAHALARKIAGVRGADSLKPIIYEQMRQGKSIDTIEDDLRYAGQSKEFAGPIREAAQSIYANANDAVAQRGMDYIDDMMAKGDTEGIKSQLKRSALTQADAEQKKSIMGKERTVNLLGEIQKDLNALQDEGIDTNIFTGTMAQIANKIGTITNPKIQKVAQKIALSIQNYRRSMSGVAFPEAETKEYKAVFPGIGKDAGFNAANIDALKEVFSGDVDHFYSMSMGDKAYKELFGKRGDGSGEGSGDGDLSANAAKIKTKLEQTGKYTPEQIMEYLSVRGIS